jgi:hypothetical protein
MPIAKKTSNMNRMNHSRDAEDFISKPLLREFSVDSLKNLIDVKVVEDKTLSRKNLPKPPPPPLVKIEKTVPVRLAPPPPQKIQNKNEDSESKSSAPAVPVKPSNIKVNSIKNKIELFNHLQIPLK